MDRPLARLEVAHVVELLADPDRDVRLEVVHHLGDHADPRVADALVARFGREWDFLVREALTWAVLRRGDDRALARVRELLAAPSWLARLQATHTLSKLGRREDGRLLEAVVDDPVDGVAARAYGAVAACGDPGLVPALVDQLSRGDAAHRNSLSTALAAFEDEALPALVGALDRPVAAVRTHAADVLGLLGAPAADAATVALVDATHDVDDGVRLAATNALGQLRTRPAWDRINELRGTTDDRRVALLATRLADRRPRDDLLVPAPPAPPTAHHSYRRAATSRRSAVDRWPEPDRALVTLADGPWVEQLGAGLARQVEVCRPIWITRAEVPPDVLARVHRRAADEATARGLPAWLRDRVAAGAVEQHVRETVLLEQVDVTDAGRTIGALLHGKDVRIVAMARPEPTDRDDGGLP